MILIERDNTMKVLSAILLSLSLTACTGLQIRDNAAQTSQGLYHAANRALSFQLDRRFEWRQGCAVLAQLELDTLKDYIAEQQSIEDKLAALDLAKERHEASLPHIHLATEYQSEGFMSEINKVKC